MEWVTGEDSMAVYLEQQIGEQIAIEEYGTLVYANNHLIPSENRLV